jgi:class 3 adenylate cyclase/predicted negative regulator of RcsB-dependent stress response
MSFSQDRTADSLKRLILGTTVDSTRVSLLIQLTKYYLNSSPEDAKKYGLEALALTEKLDDQPHRALALKFIGVAFYFQGNSREALDYYGRSLHVYDSIGDMDGKARMLSNLGNVYYSNGTDDKALDYYFQSMDVAEKNSDKNGTASAYQNIANVYLNKSATTNKALDFFIKALRLSEESGDKNIIGTASLNIGEIYRGLNKQDSALYYFDKSRDAFTNTIDIPNPLRCIGLVYANKGDFTNAVNYGMQAYEMARKFDSKLAMAQALVSLGDIYLKNNNQQSAISSYKHADSVAKLIPAYKELGDAYSGLATGYSNLGKYSSAYKYQKLFSNISDTLNNQVLADKLASLQRNFEIQSRQNQINLLTKDKALQDLDLKRQKIQKAFITGALVLIFIIAFVIYRSYRSKAKTNIILDKQKAQIEGLLLNILPSQVASELQTKGESTPRYFEKVSVLFTDFSGFTLIADALSPQEVVSELNACFIAFDGIIEKYNLEKIKTIGDSYMCAGGIPTENDVHPENMVRAGLEIRDWMKNFNEKRISLNLPVWELRIGIHVGPVVAGVVGRKKYAYDIWGSTVNIASRMESSGVPGMVNISEAVYELVKDKFYCYYRGKISAKHIKDTVMYFVEKDQVFTEDTFSRVHHAATIEESDVAQLEIPATIVDVAMEEIEMTPAVEETPIPKIEIPLAVDEDDIPAIAKPYSTSKTANAT